MNVSLSTDDPLQIHLTKEPLVEEYSVAGQQRFLLLPPAVLLLLAGSPACAACVILVHADRHNMLRLSVTLVSSITPYVVIVLHVSFCICLQALHLLHVSFCSMLADTICCHCAACVIMFVLADIIC